MSEALALHQPAGMAWRPAWQSPVIPWRMCSQERREALRWGWQHGEITHHLTPTQLKIETNIEKWSTRVGKNALLREDDPDKEHLTRCYVVDCSRRLGKSARAINKALRLGATNERWRMVYMAPQYKELRKIFATLMPMLTIDCPPGLLGEHQGPDWIKSEDTYIFRNTGTRLELLGLDKDPDAARGPAIDYGWGDEVAFFDDLEYVLQSIMMPQMMGRTHARLELQSTPPKSPAHYWSSELVKQAKREDSYDMHTIEEASQYTTEEIEEFIRIAKGRRSTTCRREYFCEHITDETLAIVPEYREVEQRIVKAWDAPKWRDCYTVMDPGWKDHTAVLFGYVDFENAKWIIEDEISAPRLNSAKVAEAVKHKESQLWKGLFCVGTNQRLRAQPLWRFSDRDRHLTEQLSREHELLFYFTKKTDLDQHINALRVAIQSEKIIIHPRCTRLRDDLRNGIWKNEAKKIFAHSEDASHFDTVAALMYFIRNADLKRNPAPREEQFVRSNKHENVSGHTEPQAKTSSKWSRRGYHYRIR